MNQLYIHVGTPKTGSSAIQAFLSLNNELLKKEGIIYPFLQDFSQPFQTSSGNGRLLCEHFKFKRENDIIGVINDNLKEYNTLFSTEIIFSLIKNRDEDFIKFIKKSNAKIIVYVRRFDEFIESSYIQSVKNNGCNIRISDYTEIEDPTISIINIIPILGKENIIVRPYEKNQFYKNNIYSDFLSIFKIEMNDNFILPEDIVNPSYSPDILEYKRLCNNLEFGGESINLKKMKLKNIFSSISVKENCGKPFQNKKLLSIEYKVKIYKESEKYLNELSKIYCNGNSFFKNKPEDMDHYEPIIQDISVEKIIKISKIILKSSNDGEDKLKKFESVDFSNISKIGIIEFCLKLFFFLKRIKI
jgi:hypothetical protein